MSDASSTYPHVSQETVGDVQVAVHDPEVQAVVTDAVAVFKETKAGWRTTEFWLTLAGLVAVNASGLVMTLPDRYQAIASAILAGLYALSRGQAKQGIPAVQADAPEA